MGKVACIQDMDCVFNAYKTASDSLEKHPKCAIINNDNHSL